ncbi:hypothetical protein C943_00226 [Mariniradius saccharolyticus AK6]|uniref:Uncharacterized protein n=1 Tax=Mariniradius saccharolyticus AK6 TaxID=1239962 RepID=M7XLV5_9BACT|nr:hypothetical protein C943_00226 [Mariniradius saccharolyticus AK6]
MVLSQLQIGRNGRAGLQIPPSQGKTLGYTTSAEYDFNNPQHPFPVFGENPNPSFNFPSPKTKTSPIPVSPG